MSYRAAVLWGICCAGCGAGDSIAAGADVGDPRVLARLEEMHARSPEDALVRYNLGTVHLHAGRFDEARGHLEAAAGSDSARVRQPAQFNLGNSDLEPAFADGDHPQRREALLRAIGAYKEALLLEPGDGDAKWNLELARRLLDQQPDSPSSGGGGGGGGGGDDPRTGSQDPRPRPAGESGPQPPLTPAEAEEILSSAQLREVGLQREKLRKQQPRTRSAH